MVWLVSDAIVYHLVMCNEHWKHVVLCRNRLCQGSASLMMQQVWTKRRKMMQKKRRISTRYHRLKMLASSLTAQLRLTLRHVSR